jgi:hypothetical protein
MGLAGIDSFTCLGQLGQSLLLFLLYINDIASCFKSSNFLVYADDIKIFNKINSNADSVALQEDLDRLYDYCMKNQLFLNIKKCNSISFSRSVKPIIPKYSINNEQLDAKTEIRDLGVILDSKMLFKSHINRVIEKSFKQLNFILRVSKPFNNVNTMKTLYFTYVRSSIEFATVIWNPQYITYIDRLENVQNKFIKALDYKTKSPYNDPLTSRKRYNITSLENRRTITDMTFLYKIVNNITDCTDLLNKICFNVPNKNTRKINTFRPPSCTTNYSQNSYIYRTCTNYNAYFNSVDLFSNSLPVFKKLIFGLNKNKIK